MAEKTTALAIEKTDTVETTGEKPVATRDDALYLSPPVDIFETEEALIVVADLPGVEKGEVDIRVEEDILTIRGKASYIPQGNILREEFNVQGYYRQFQLSDEVDQNKISAEAKHGVLTITLPKAEKSKPRQIRVKAG